MDIERELKILTDKHMDDAVCHVQQPETNIQLTNEQIDRLVECAVDLMKTLYPLLEDVLKIVKHYLDDIEEVEE